MKYPRIKPGDKFGRLTVVEFSHKGSNRKQFWRCLCECGESRVAFDGHLKNGSYKSCGCYRKEAPLERTTHGNASRGNCTSEYIAWQRMKSRCYNEKERYYFNYGGRGIVVCERWLNSFENFLTDMGPKPSKSHSIERKDNDKNYTPDNCVWATRGTQSRNKRNNVVIEFNGKAQCISAWVEELDIPRGTICSRIKRGLPLEEVFKVKAK